MLDKLVNSVTAMQTMDELRAAMDGGYVPTIHPDTRRKRLLTRTLLAMGYRVWAGRLLGGVNSGR